MIRCYYPNETLGSVAKAWQRRLIFDGGFWVGIMVLGLVLSARLEPNKDSMPVLLFAYCFFGGVLLWIHWSVLHVEKTTLQHKGDVITLDNYGIRLCKEDGTQIMLPRDGLEIESIFRASSRHIIKISNSQFASISEIVLTTYMENVQELIESIKPGVWAEMNRSL